MKGTIFSTLCVVALAQAAVFHVKDSIVTINDDPSQASVICAAKDSNGVLVANEYCSYFYICTFGVPVTRKCPAGLLYDPREERCEWPNTVECGNRVIGDREEDSDEPSNGGNGPVNDNPSQAGAICAAEGSDHSYVAHENCDKFYQCWAGRPVALPCPPNTLWNPKKRYCDFPSNVVCGDRTISGNNNPDRDDNVISDGGGKLEDDAPIGNNHYDPSQAPQICATKDSSGVLVAHERCNRFYICTFGRPVAQICPSGLLFDPTRDRCEWPNIVNCGNRIIPDGDDEIIQENVTEGSVNDDPSQAAVICAAEGSDHSYVAHENCAKFYQCWAGRPVALPCPPNTLWNPKRRYCDFPSNVVCGDRTINVNNNPDRDDGVIVDVDAPVGNNHDDPSQAPQICATPDSSGVLIAHERCNRFYTCTFGKPVAQICPSGLLFDPTRDRCEWPSIVNCGNRIIPDGDDEIIEENVTEGSVNDDPSQAGTICAAEGSDHSYVAHENCAKFYQCWAGRPVALPCPPNTLWNPKKRYCDFPNNVDCSGRRVPGA